jgi:hypothetical protein
MPAVVSSYLAALEWKDGDGLVAQFKNGRVAKYPDVTEDVYQAVIGSSSVGSAFDQLVKKAGYSFSYLV